MMCLVGGLCIVYISRQCVIHAQVVLCPSKRFYDRVDILSKDFVLHMTGMCGSDMLWPGCFS